MRDASAALVDVPPNESNLAASSRVAALCGRVSALIRRLFFCGAHKIRLSMAEVIRKKMAGTPLARNKGATTSWI